MTATVPHPDITGTALAPRDAKRLRDDAAVADASGALTAAQRALVHCRGWLGMLAPRAVGGAEWPLPRVVALEEALAEADGSTAWVVTLCAGAAWFAGFWPPALARHVLATHRACVAGSGAATGSAEHDGDGWRLQGRWAHASGAPWATHFTVNAVLHEHGVPLHDAGGAPRVAAFVVPARCVHVEPTWRAIGLRASASHALRIDGAWVPASHRFAIDAAHATHDGPLWRFPFRALAFATLAAVTCGIARHFVALAMPAVAVRLASEGAASPLREAARDAPRQLTQARDAFYARLDAAWARVEAGLPAHDAATAVEAAARELVHAARRAVDDLYPACGLPAADAGSDINRVWRDLHTATQHALWWT
ncbi:acyl-CoA dehydrogenase [Azohydromonas sediminis]|uniref:acyl-CoA dehydrogenase n=1 Tax=Azohydromonas sediminis TaxID=2259674 RepID=UPI000E64CAA2|nr:acyl-CoA dehydrogenase [Azohydromonas sediminis]